MNSVCAEILCNRFCGFAAGHACELNLNAEFLRFREIASLFLGIKKRSVFTTRCGCIWFWENVFRGITSTNISALNNPRVRGKLRRRLSVQHLCCRKARPTRSTHLFFYLPQEPFCSCQGLSEDIRGVRVHRIPLFLPAFLINYIVRFLSFSLI